MHLTQDGPGVCSTPGKSSRDLGATAAGSRCLVPVRGLLSIVVVATCAIPTPAEACSCGSFDRLTPASCRGAKRVFAGTVAEYRWPTAYDHGMSAFLRWRRPVEVELAIDRAWKGEVPSSLVAVTGYGGGDCGIHPLPGTRFVVCDDEADDAPPDFGFCSHPAFEDPSLEAALGDSDTPVRSFWRPRPLWWREPLLVPLVFVAVFALLGRRGRRAPSDAPVRSHVLLLAMAACAAATGAMRAIAVVAKVPLLAAYGPVVLAAVLGGVVGFQGQRRFVGWFGGLSLAIAFAALPVSLGYAPLHLPWNQDAVACSRQRAEEILARDEPLEEALVREPYACTDWDMARYRVVQDHCLAFPDGDGGEWYVCREDGVTSTFIGPELPR